jgi:hypothetical protein
MLTPARAYLSSYHFSLDAYSKDRRVEFEKIKKNRPTIFIVINVIKRRIRMLGI